MRAPTRSADRRWSRWIASPAMPHNDNNCREDHKTDSEDRLGDGAASGSDRAHPALLTRCAASSDGPASRHRRKSELAGSCPPLIARTGRSPLRIGRPSPGRSPVRRRRTRDSSIGWPVGGFWTPPRFNADPRRAAACLVSAVVTAPALQVRLLRRASSRMEAPHYRATAVQDGERGSPITVVRPLLLPNAPASWRPKAQA